MNCWKNNFNEKTLKRGLKYKNNIKNISYDGYTSKQASNQKTSSMLNLFCKTTFCSTCPAVAPKNHPALMRQECCIF